MVENSAKVLKTREAVIGISVLADSAIVLSVKPWVPVSETMLTQAELYQTLVERFRDEGI